MKLLNVFKKEYWTKEFWNSKRIAVVVVSFSMGGVGIYGTNKFNESYKFGYNPYYDTSTSCMDERFYLEKKIKTAQERNEALKLGNIVVFQSPKIPSKVYMRQVKFAKYVGGVPGDHIKIKNQKLYINNKYISTRSDVMVEKLRKHGWGNLTEDADYIIPEGEFFALGENNDVSFDSRFYGAAPEDSIVGIVVWKGVTWL